jgi:molybdopterin-guanine dinucleotide biosynthesis adapter protein
MNNVAIPIISIVGKSDVGKTTVLEKVIRELKGRGYRLATIKHHVHWFEIDQPGKDTWRHAQAGSDVVVIAAPNRLAMIRELESELSLAEIAAMIQDVDIIITEGYKRGNKPKIEVSRAARSPGLICTREELFALVTDQDHPEMEGVPQFDLNDTINLVDLIESEFLTSTSSTDI